MMRIFSVRFLMLLALLFSLSLFSATGTMAFGGHGPGKYGKGGERHQEMMGQMFEELGLSEVQQEELKKHQTAHRESAKGFFEEMKDVRMALKEELEKRETDMARVEEIAGRLKALQAKMIDHRIEGILAVKRILTPEQFEEFGEKMKSRMKERHKQGGYDKGGMGK